MHSLSPTTPLQGDSLPSKCYLECLTLPNDDATKLDVRQVATVTMAHLDRLAEPYNAFDLVSATLKPNLATFLDRPVHNLFLRITFEVYRSMVS